MKRFCLFALFFLIFVSVANGIKTIKVNETGEINLGIRAFDPDNDNISVSFTQPLDENGRWKTNFGDAGEYKSTIKVSDGELTTSEDVLLIVTKLNIQPKIESYQPSGSASIKEGESIEFSVKASDVNKDRLEYTWIVDGSAAGDGSKHNFYADYGFAGTHEIEVFVSDGEKEASNKWQVNVEKVDRALLLDSLSDVSVTETEKARLSLPEFDKYNLEYEISPPLEKGVWETGYDDAGEYDVTISISDRDFSASKTIKVTVLNKDRPPVIKAVDNAWIKENEKISFDVEASDPDGDEVEVRAEGVPKGANFNGKTFSWETNYETIQKDNIFKKAVDKLHLLIVPFKVDIIAKSKELESKESSIIFVSDVNRQPALEELRKITVNEGEEVVISPKATDPDGDSVSYSYSGWMSRDSYITTFDDAGEYVVYVTASDGFLSDKKYVEISVVNKNREPALGDIGDFSVNENEELTFEVNASDPDRDTLSVTAENLPEGAEFENNVFLWKPGYNASKDTDYKVTFTASDGELETKKEASIKVNNANRAPVASKAKPFQDAAWMTGKPITLQVEASDPDGDELQYLWDFGIFERYNASSAMQRTFSTPGVKKVKVSVSDGIERVEHEWRINVAEAVKEKAKPQAEKKAAVKKSAK